MCSTEEAGGYEPLRLPCDTDWTAWHRFCFGRPSGSADAASTDAQEDGSNGAAAMVADGAEGGEQPTLPVLLSMDPVRASPALVCQLSIPHTPPDAVNGRVGSISCWVGIRPATGSSGSGTCSASRRSCCYVRSCVVRSCYCRPCWGGWRKLKLLTYALCCCAAAGNKLAAAPHPVGNRRRPAVSAVGGVAVRADCPARATPDAGCHGLAARSAHALRKDEVCSRLPGQVHSLCSQ